MFVTLIVWDGWFEHEPLSSFYIRRTIFWGLRVNEKSQFGKALDILLLLLFLHLMLVRIWSRKYKSFCVHCSLLFTWISRYLETWEDVMEILIKIEICSGQFCRVHSHERGHFFFPILAMDMWQRLLELNLSPSLGTCFALDHYGQKYSW